MLNKTLSTFLVSFTIFLVFMGTFSVATGKGFQKPKDVSFISKSDSTEQKYILLLPEEFNPNTLHNVLIALHGHGRDRWQFATADIGQARAARDVASDYNMIFISPDYRAKTSWMGPKAEADLVQIINDIKKKYKVAKVFLTGASMGGTSSLTFAALHPNLIAGVASMNGSANLLEFKNYQGAIIKSFGGTKKQIPLVYKQRSAEYWPEKLTMPLGITLSGKDTKVSPKSVMRLIKVLKAIGHKKIKVIFRPEMGHTTKYDDAKAIIEYILKGEIK